MSMAVASPPMAVVASPPIDVLASPPVAVVASPPIAVLTSSGVTASFCSSEADRSAYNVIKKKFKKHEMEFK